MRVIRSLRITGRTRLRGPGHGLVMEWGVRRRRCQASDEGEYMLTFSDFSLHNDWSWTFPH